MTADLPPAAPEETGVAAKSVPLSPADERLMAYFRDLEQKSLDTLEGAARQLITLVTTLLGLFFGVLAFKDSPTYLALPAVRVLGGLAAGFYVLTLFLALNVVMPRRLDVPLSSLTGMRRLLQALFDRKSRSLFWAQAAFALGTLALLALILLLLARAG
ncbi:MAG: hypothetical protein RML46_12855 [Anaerolineae bacterium]|nr:hypothetical protein [Anaerolineae bacterium]MDW8069783.1 hypothetical protein [Anaerolineae bacterium]